MNMYIYSHCYICDVDKIQWHGSCTVAQELPNQEIWVSSVKERFVVQTKTVIMVSFLISDYTSAVKLVNRESLLHEKEAKKMAEAAKAEEKERKKAEKAALQAELDAQRKIKPWEMFLSQTDKYSKFDDKVWNFVLIGVICNLCSITCHTCYCIYLNKMLTAFLTSDQVSNVYNKAGQRVALEDTIYGPWPPE